MGSVLLIGSEMSSTIKSRREIVKSVIYLFQERHVSKVSNTSMLNFRTHLREEGCSNFMCYKSHLHFSVCHIVGTIYIRYEYISRFLSNFKSRTHVLAVTFVKYSELITNCTS